MPELPPGYSMVSSSRLATVLRLAQSEVNRMKRFVPPYEADMARHHGDVKTAQDAVQGIHVSPEDEAKSRRKREIRNLTREWEPIAELMTKAYEAGRSAGFSVD